MVYIVHVHVHIHVDVYIICCMLVTVHTYMYMSLFSSLPIRLMLSSDLDELGGEGRMSKPL